MSAVPHTMPQPWIYSARLDSAFILAPALVITALVLLLREPIAAMPTMPAWSWAVLIIGVDVAHVYATLFRTYADPDELRQHPALYLLTPLLCWAGGALLYSIDALWFWRTLTYLAVFHFVRQQYGFMMLYSRREQAARWRKRLDQAVIYAATLYPLLYWHTHLPRQFNWFIADDFVALPGWLNHAGLMVYLLLLAAYCVQEAQHSWQQRQINWPKNLLLLGTVLSWSVGIVVFNNDLAFTALNVVAHGVPYIALIWVFCRNRTAQQPADTPPWLLGKFFALRWLPLYLLLLIGFAYLEEGLWDGLVWRDHPGLFHSFQNLPRLNDPALLAWLVPLLALPQSTHYALDAFIWRLKGPDNRWRTILFGHV